MTTALFLDRLARVDDEIVEASSRKKRWSGQRASMMGIRSGQDLSSAANNNVPGGRGTVAVAREGLRIGAFDTLTIGVVGSSDAGITNSIAIKGRISLAVTESSTTVRTAGEDRRTG